MIRLFLLLLVLSGCVHHKPSPQDQFYANLLDLCGQTFVGASTFPLDPNHDFAGKELVAHFQSCDDTEIRIKFDVGADRSRTWVITTGEAGLLLKHDHRHSDGTPDEITNYGGWATDQGDAWSQHFAADADTAALIPEAQTNVWMLQYLPATEVLIYDLKRHGKPRYQAQLGAKKHGL